jgi:acetyl-CoA carboxylase carboxyltransferase component
VEGDTVARLVRTAADTGVPVVGVLDTSGADVGEGVAALHAWGRIAAAMVAASGVVPIVLIVTGPCVSGPALLLGLADVVIMTADSFAYVSGPGAVREMTGMDVTHQQLGSSAVHAGRAGTAALVADDEDEAVAAAVHVLAYLPGNNLEEPHRHWCDDPIEREVSVRIPGEGTASYDVRTVIADVVDTDSVMELWGRHAPNVVTTLAAIDGWPVGVIANQPSRLAGTLDIEASSKAARFVQLCDAFNLPLVTFVDTPGFQPGKDIEWRGMIRHGAELVHAYAAATVPRVCVVLRKAYGGAYIVMDSKGLGNDACFSWPSAELAVMGASGAVQILHGKRLSSEDERVRLETEYSEKYLSPAIAAERGYVDDVIDPGRTREVVALALRALRHKREHLPRRRHSNTPL